MKLFALHLSLLITLALLSWPDSAGWSAEPKPATQVDLRPHFARWGLPIKKQGARNTCSVFTTTGAMEYALSKKFNRGLRLSEEYLNWSCNQVIQNTTQDRGQFFADLLKGYELHGICPEADMPYAKAFSGSYQPTARATNDAKLLKNHGLRANWIKPNDGKVGITDAHIEQMKATLRKGWPVCGGSAHSVLVVGFKDDPAIAGGGHFLLRDSGGGNEQTMTYQAAKARLCDLLWYDTAPPPTK